MRKIEVVLVHHPVVGKEGDVVTTAITNLDVHDIARSSRTYGCDQFHIVHPIEAQRQLVGRIVEHWVTGSGKRRIPDRADALELVRLHATLEQVFEALGGRSEVDVWVTAAASKGRPTQTYRAAREKMREEGKPVLLVFGTGWGLAPAVVDSADMLLEPIVGSASSAYNHLSVRAACAISLDRLIG